MRQRIRVLCVIDVYMHVFIQQLARMGERNTGNPLCHCIHRKLEGLPV